MLAIRMIGEFEVEYDGAKVELPSSRRATALLAWLALHPGRHPRSRLAAQFWPDVLDASARASLRSAVWALRASLGPAAASHLLAERDAVGLAGEGLTVDLREFDRLASAGRFDDALALCRGELLYGFDDEWAYAARDEHAARLAAVLNGQSRQAEARGDTDKALMTANRLLLLQRLSPVQLGDELSGGRYAEAEPTASRPLVDLDAMEPSFTASRPLIGRGEEFGLLLGHWRAARAGRGAVVAIAGEGGIGKTRLCEELRSVAERSGCLAVTGAAGGPGGGSPLALWSEALHELLAESAAPEHGLTAGAAELAMLLTGAGARSARPRTTAEPHLERVRLFESVVELIARAARDRPLLLVLEDLHQADPSSLDLAAYAGRRLVRLPVLLVLTRRHLPPRPDLDAALAALRTRGALKLVLDLKQLSAASIRELARTTADLPDEAVEQIAAIVGGSPLLAVEAALACARGDQDRVGGLADAVRAATARLTGPARLVVELLAVAGRDVERGDLLNFPVPDPERAATEALGADLLRARAGTVGFRHALLCEAVYHALPDPLRARLHDAFVEILRRRAGGSAGGRRAAELARHLRLAGRDALAVGQLATAASDARAVAALPEAAGFLREAVAIEPHDPELFVELAEVEAWRGLLEESDAAFARALELIAPADAGSLVSAWLRRGRWMRGGLCYPRESKRSYRSALDVLDRDPAADPPARAEALVGLAWAEAVAGDPVRVEELLREAGLIIGKQHGPGDLLGHDLGIARGHALIRAGRFKESYAPLIAASAAAGRAGRPDMAYTCLINAASAAACAGDFERALDFADRCLPLVEPNGLLRLSIYVHSARCAILRRLGRYDEAAAACRAEADLAERIGRADLEGLARHDRGLLAAARGEPDAAAADLAAALALDAPVSRPLVRLWRAQALVRAGRLDEAEAELRETALEPIGPGDFPDTLVARMNRVQGLAAAHRGDAAAARRRLESAAAAWQRRVGGAAETGERYVAVLVDLGRPPLSSLAEPERELAAIAADLATLGPAPQP